MIIKKQLSLTICLLIILKQYQEKSLNENTNYTKLKNIGIKYAMDYGSDYVCILNNDTIVSPHFLINLVDYFKYYLHGLFNIVDKQYPFIYINKNQTW